MSSVSADHDHSLDTPNQPAQAQGACCVEGVESDNEEQNLTCHQLRRLYDDEEIERFLSVFSKHVTEVTLPPSTYSNQSKQQAAISHTNDLIKHPFDTGSNSVGDSDTETDTGEPWTYFHGSNPSTNVLLALSAQATETSPLVGSPKKRPFLLPRSQPKSLSTHVAAWIIPKLPPTSIAPSSNFRVSSARLAGQRLYVVAYPMYVSLLTDLIALAAWTNWNRSACVCSAWWVLWYFDILLPALLGKILFSLLRRRVFAYPNLEELKERRTITRSANYLSASLKDYGAGASFLGTGPWPRMSQNGADMGTRDMLRLAQTVTKGKIKKAREKSKYVAGPTPSQSGSSPKPDGETHANQHHDEDEDWRRGILKALESIADFHERMRNLYFWRHGKSSWMYALALIITLLLAVLTPTQLLAKITYAFIGVVYWFIVPVLLAVPSEDRRRIPPPFFDVPTDAEYAMGLMSLRVANGERVPASYRRGQENHRARRYTTNGSVGSVAWKGTDSKAADQKIERHVANLDQGARGIDRGVDRIGAANADADVRVTTVANSGPDMGTPVAMKNREEGRPTDELGSNTDNSVVSPRGIDAPRCTPASHKAVPGVLCLDSSALSFTPMLMNTPHLWIHIGRVQSVKKTHRTNGLRVRHLNEQGHEKEDVFRFVLKRDEIFVELQECGDRR